MVRRVRSFSSFAENYVSKSCSIFKMGQHFVSILTMLHIANKKKDPHGAVIYLLYVSAEAVKLRFTGILRVFDTELLII